MEELNILKLDLVSGGKADFSDVQSGVSSTAEMIPPCSSIVMPYFDFRCVRGHI